MKLENDDDYQFAIKSREVLIKASEEAQRNLICQELYLASLAGQINSITADITDYHNGIEAL